MDFATIIAGVSGFVVIASFVIFYLYRSAPETVAVVRSSDELSSRKEERKSKERKEKANKKSVKKSNKEDQQAPKGENKSPKNGTASAKNEPEKPVKKSSFGVAGGTCRLCSTLFS